VLKKIEENISKNRLFDKKSKLLLGMSGGIDSVALASILAESYSVSLAHCNFNLRGKESKADEKFCESLAEKMGLPIYIQSFDTVKISKQRGISIQMAARELRYQWFEELLKKHKLDRIVTAHHADDRIETFFINLIRGSGVKGLKGMKSRNGNVVRPMLEISKKEIQVYAEKKKIRFREDSSNNSDKYERNFLRHHIIPLFHKLNPSFDQTMIKNLNILKDESRIVQEYLSNISKKLIIQSDKSTKIRKGDLLQTDYPLSLLHQFLEPFGFNYSQMQSVLKNISRRGVSGKKFFSSTNEMTIGKEFIQVKRIGKKTKDKKFSKMSELKRSTIFKVDKLNEFILPLKNEVILREKDLQFPVSIRSRMDGDRFHPFGMKGTKLVSDFLKDEKVEAYERDQVKILVNGNKDILWVIPFRSNERYRIGKNEKGKFIKLSWFE